MHKEANMQENTCTYKSTGTHTYTAAQCIYTHIGIHTVTQMHIYKHIPTQMHVHTHKYTQAHTHIQADIYVYKHT